MGLFRKKKVVDLRELPQRSVNLPHGRKFVPKDGWGFVDLTKKPKLPSQIRAEKSSKGVFAPSNVFSSGDSANSSADQGAFSFFDSPVGSSSTTPTNVDNSEILRKISMQISDLDTKIYKLEQRIEVLERKNGIGGIGW